MRLNETRELLRQQHLATIVRRVHGAVRLGVGGEAISCHRLHSIGQRHRFVANLVELPRCLDCALLTIEHLRGLVVIVVILLLLLIAGRRDAHERVR